MTTNRIGIYLFLATFLLASGAYAQNYIDTSVWTPGTGSQGLFTKYGADDENVRENGENPYGDTSILWRAQSNTDNSDVPSERSDGGIYTHIFPIDHTKNYRFHVWIKKEVSAAGTTYLGLHSYGTTSTRLTQRLDGTTNTNPYFWYGDLPQLGKWYLIVGYMYASDYTDPGTGVTSAVYDGETGLKVLNGRSDYKFSPAATRMRLRTLFYRSDDTSAYQHYYDPSVYEVNDQMPTIEELINPDVNPPGGESLWSLNGTDIYYSGGNVGINTSIPDYELTVKGRIHAEEVKVDLNVPAPDYVFEENYGLMTLDEVQQFIDAHGHLPNIPSAKEMETNGVELGRMEMRLLEKIEELTLYMIELKNENEAIKKQLKVLQKQE